jgi:PE family
MAMSFVTAVPEFVTAAAGDLADIGSALGAANTAAALPTTGVAAAAADEVSTQVAAIFDAYALKYQALSAQAAAFHNEFVSLLNGSALGYLTTEAANAEQNLLNAMTAPTAAGSAATLPILGGLGSLLGGGTGAPTLGLPGLSSLLGSGSGILGGLSPLLGGGPLGPILNGVGADLGGVLSSILNGSEASLLSNPLGPVLLAISGAFANVPPLQGLEPLLQPLLPNLFEAGVTASQAGNPWQMLFANTGANLETIFGRWAADPFPVLKQVIINWNGYAQEFGSGLALVLQDFPAYVANVPANIQLFIQGASTFNPAALAQAYINQQIGYTQTIVTSLQKAGADFQTTVPVFEADMGMAGQAIATGDYHGAVQDVAHGLIGLFITGFDTSNLSDVKVLGPAGDLLPILGIPAQQAQNFTNLLPPGSIPAQIAQNYTNLVSTLTSSNTATTFTLNLTNPSANVLQADAFFGLPLSLGFAVIGPFITTLDGFATGATVFGAAVQTGNGVAAVGALVDMPAYVLNGFLNGETIVDLTLPVSTATAVGGLGGPLLGPLLQQILGLAGPLDPTVPIVVHLPFDGILVPQHPITATLDVTVAGVTTPLNVNLGGTPFGGVADTLLNYLPEQLAAAIVPK